MKSPTVNNYAVVWNIFAKLYLMTTETEEWWHFGRGEMKKGGLPLTWRPCYIGHTKCISSSCSSGQKSFLLVAIYYIYVIPRIWHVYNICSKTPYWPNCITSSTNWKMRKAFWIIARDIWTAHMVTMRSLIICWYDVSREWPLPSFKILQQT